MNEPFEWTYDFDRDAWVASSVIRPAWAARELPAPEEPPRPGFWTAPPPARRARRPVPPWVYVVAFAGVVALLSGSWCLFFSILTVLLPITVGEVRTPPNQDDDLLEIGNDHDVCVVEMSVMHSERVVGTDRGVVWFEGGRLMFNGRRTSFALGGEDVLPRSLYFAPEREQRAVLHGVMLPLRAPGLRTYVSFIPVEDGRELAKARFLERFGAFRSHPPPSRGPRQWPPFE